ncbi:MAG: peptide-methionine (S)-S-oxide reductase MsrA [Armatimonadota bacterium]
MGKMIAVMVVATGILLMYTRWGQPRNTIVLTQYGRKHQVHTMEKATFGAGCFWGVEAAFRKIPGVISTAVGYTGGRAPAPSYEQVCGGNTGHTESVEVTFDPARVTYQQLLDVFWRIHDPTVKKKTQYKSVIFYHTPEQRAAAETGKERQIGQVLTDILPVQTFYLAEDYHQQYNEKHGIQGDACGLP